MGKKSFSYLNWNPAGRLILVGMFVLLWISRSEAQVFSPYADFQAMSLEQLKTLQVKLTYLGEQGEVISSVAFTSPFNTLDLGLFVPFRRPEFSYSNDDSGVQTFTASPTELKAVIDNVATLPNVTAGGVSNDPYLSFAMLNTAGGTKAFEAVLNKADSVALFSKLRLALQGNKVGLTKLASMACPLDLLELERPTDVSASVGVTIGGVRLDRTTGHFVGTATIKNNSSASISGPLSVVFILEGNVNLFNADGFTCGISPPGREFINLTLTGNTLPAGATVQVKLEFNNLDLEPIRATTKVLAGPGAR